MRCQSSSIVRPSAKIRELRLYNVRPSEWPVRWGRCDRIWSITDVVSTDVLITDVLITDVLITDMVITDMPVSVFDLLRQETL